MTLQPTNMPTANVDSSSIDSESGILQNDINTTDPAFIDPQVLEAMVSAQLPNNLVFTPLATVNTTLQGVPGDTITVPRWKFTGTVKDVKEGGKLPLFKLAQASQQVKVKKPVVVSESLMKCGYQLMEIHTAKQHGNYH